MYNELSDLQTDIIALRIRKTFVKTDVDAALERLYGRVVAMIETLERQTPEYQLIARFKMLVRDKATKELCQLIDNELCKMAAEARKVFGSIKCVANGRYYFNSGKTFKPYYVKTNKTSGYLAMLVYVEALMEWKLIWGE